MFRRQILYGITLILIVVIIFLLMRGRNAEKEQRAAQDTKMEEIASEPPSPVRAILPRDLEIVEAKVSWIRNPDEKDAATARHDITIRNIGEGSYVSLWLRMEYADEKGKPVEIRTHEVNEALPSGGTLRLSGIDIEGLPDAVSDFRAAILSADLQSGVYQN
jgi:hypothetical protein